jgi:hypothetical protein
MARVGEQLGLVGYLDDAAEIHHGDAVADMGDDRKVVRDEEIGKAVVALQVDQQIDHLRLDGDVKRGDRLVAHDQARAKRERARDADALALAAGELMREILHLVRPQANLPEQLGDARLFCLAAGKPVHAERLADDVARGHARIERGERVLEHDLHRAAHRAHVGLAQRRDIGAVELDAAGGRLDQPQHGARHRRLAAAGFSDEAQRLADTEREADAVDRMHGADLPAQHAAAHRKMLDEVLHLEQGAGLAHDAFASSAARQQAAR